MERRRLLFAQRSPPWGRKVIAIEPNPKILERLNDNIVLNNLSSNIAVHDVAVGDKKGVVKLTIADSDFGSSSVVDHSVGTNHISVQISPLLEILKKEMVGAASIIKIDIEGMEDRALFPYFEAIKPQNYPKLIVMEDGINSHWDRDILSWLQQMDMRVRRGPAVMSCWL